MDTRLGHGLFAETIAATGLLSHEDFVFAQNKAHTENKTLAMTLLELGLLSEEELMRIEALISGVSFVDLEGEHIAPEIFSQIPEPLSRTHRSVCFASGDDGLSIACLDLADAQELANALPDTKIIPHLTDKTSLYSVLRSYQKHLAGEFGSQLNTALSRMRKPDLFRGLEERLPESYHTEIAEDISTEKVFRNIIKHAQLNGASHIYLTPTETHTRISYRIGPRLYDAMHIDRDALPGLIVKLRHLIDRSITGDEVSSGFASFEHDDHATQLQVLFFDTSFGKKAVIRLLNNNELFDSFESLIASGTQQELIYRKSSNSALTLISGKPKSGATRAYYGLLEHQAGRQTEVVSLENPIEVAISGVSQLSFSNKKNPKRLLEQVVASRPDVVGFSPLSLPVFNSVFSYMRSGISLIAEVGDLTAFAKQMVQKKMLTSAVVSKVGLIIDNVRFRRVSETEQKAHKLTRANLTALSRYITEGELESFLQHEGILSPKASLSSIEFTIRKKTKRSDKNKMNVEVYVRGAFDLSEIIESSQRIDSVGFTNKLRLLQKRAIVENALLRSHAGEICINDIITYLND